ncbi:unnamed protein product [Durusdinium trenchii]|uniref:Histone RNA hairpin-binding protein RNA-binding domain-containing protein n=2 Tax=Durusdinium trenchii TaxID=1381693 RepID=A0ABP0NDI6_9DINO
MPLTIDPAINMWDQGRWDLFQERLDQRFETSHAGLKLGNSSPWSVAMPDPLISPSFLPDPMEEAAWSSHWSEPKYVRLTHPTERVDWMLDSPHPPRAVSTNVVPPIRALHARAGMAPGAGRPVAPLDGARPERTAPEHVTRAATGGTPEDPGLSGQRLKRVLHVKQAPIYKYAEWCSYWRETGRRPEDPATPRSELTKSEFDIQYGAWRKALVEGPPRSRR